MSPRPEKDVLLSHLAAQRRHIRKALEGLTDEQLLAAPLPSGWSVIALIHHLAVDDEMFWFRCVLGADEAAIAALDGDGWKPPAGLSPRDVLTLYDTQAEQADRVLATLDLDEAPAWWPDDVFGGWRLCSARAVLLHALTEISCHAGHLDAAVELVDGRQHLVL